MFLTANGITVSCEISGTEGCPWLIFSNSLATDLTMWDDQAQAFERSHRILRYDQRGHGQTDAPNGRYSFATLIADIIDIMDKLKIDKADFCGLSMGGATALGFAQLHPDRLRKVIVCDSPCASNPEAQMQWEERMATAKMKGMDALVEPTIGRWFPEDTVRSNRDFLPRLRRMISNTPVNGFYGCAAALGDHDFRSNAANVNLPVLLLVGEKDGSVPLLMSTLRDQIPNSRFVELPGAGHISNMDQPEAFNAAVRDFLTA